MTLKEKLRLLADIREANRKRIEAWKKERKIAQAEAETGTLEIEES